MFKFLIIGMISLCSLAPVEDCGTGCWRAGYTGHRDCSDPEVPNHTICRLQCAIMAGQFHDACFNQFQPCDLNPLSEACGLCMNEADVIMEACFDYCTCTHTI